MEPDSSGLERLRRQVRRDGFAFAGADEVDPLLDTLGGLDDWADFAASWDRLEPDQYLIATGRRRRRRHAVFAWAVTDPGGEGTGRRRLPPQPHFQTTVHNPLQGGIERWFAPMEDVAVGTSFCTLARLGVSLFEAVDGGASTPWFIEAHQFRIEATPGQAGEPTPEGMHRDGVDYVLVAMIARHNIERGTTSIHAPDGTTLGSFTLTRPRDIALVDDHRVFHGVTAVTPRDPEAAAHRDVLVLTYRRQPPA